MDTKEVPAPKEFPDYTIPQCILDLGLKDQSWHNDVCPSFLMYERGDAATMNDYEYVDLWVDHPDPAQREFPEWPRFRICVETNEGGYCLLDTDSLEEVMARIEAMKESLELINQNKLRAIESCDKSWAVVEGMSSGCTTGTLIAMRFASNAKILPYL